MKNILVAVGGGLISVLIVALWILSSSSSSRTSSSGGLVHRGGRPLISHNNNNNDPTALARRTNSHFRHRPKHENRIAIIIPFYGESIEAIPSYLDLFCTAAAGSADLVDFLIVHNGILQNYTTAGVVMDDYPPSNVQFINVGSSQTFVELLMRVVDHKTHYAVESKDKLRQIVTYHIHQYPYVLVEFKPAMGHIFESYLTGYTHWGYADLDIVFGDLPRWITSEELTDYDIVTYGYGDQHRAYLRGQFTFHKNINEINQLWRECNYLSDMDQRFANVLAGKTKLRVESAEGCYSAAILKRTDIRVKYAVKAFTDVVNAAHDSIYTHGLYIGIGSKQDRSVIYKAGSHDDGGGGGKALLDLSPTWFEESSNIYGAKEQAPLQRQVGTREIVPRKAPGKTKCMYWVPESYQKDICIEGVSSNETLFWIHGQLYKQPFENADLPGNVLSRPFFHFQEWKRYYRPAQLATVHRRRSSDDALLGWVLAKEGAIPIVPHVHETRWASLIASPLGHANMVNWQSVNDDKSKNRNMLPHARYCLRSGPRKHPPVPVVAACFRSVSWQDYDQVEILHGAPVWKHINIKREVTLSLTLQITQKQAANHKALTGILDIAIANMKAWQGQPCVLVIHVSGATPESLAIIRSRFAALEPDATLVAMISQEESTLVSRKALLNMASDAAPTRWVTSGLELERGLALSNEASALAYRHAKIHDESTGSVLIMPQFAIEEEDDGASKINLSFNDLAEMRRTGEPVLYGPDEYDEDCDEDNDGDKNEVWRPVLKLWWRLSTRETGVSNVEAGDDAFYRDVALALDDMQLSFTKLLTNESEHKLLVLDSSPILMTDSIGPFKGTRTSELAREVEELGGKRCYNGLRLAQLAALGYTIDVMTAAFAVSTRASRQAAYGDDDEADSDKDASGSSRCHGCFMFDEKHESILTDILTDERVRPAKASVLWDDMKMTPMLNS